MTIYTGQSSQRVDLPYYPIPTNRRFSVYKTIINQEETSNRFGVTVIVKVYMVK